MNVFLNKLSVIEVLYDRVIISILKKFNGIRSFLKKIKK